MARRRREGLALVLVLTVILALAVIATPFVLSMLLQERGAQAARCESQAWYSVDGGKNFAHWAMMNGTDCMERRYPSGAFRTYYYDTLDEIQVSVANASLPAASVLDPKGSIWGVSVQDEQGKLNFRTAPERVIRSLQDFLRNVATNPRDFITIHSGRDAAWVFPQRIRSLGDRPLPDDPNTSYYGVGVDNASHFGKGARIRVSKQDARPMYARVTMNGLAVSPSRGNTLETDPQIPAGYADGIIEVEARHPVNVNTARPEVLMALFEGLSLFNVPNSSVDRAAAARLAMALSGGRVERLERFVELLAGIDLAPEQRVAVALNAIDPGYALLDGSGTMPLCYKTYDAYTFESHASQNNPAGVQVAGRGCREVVTVSPPVPLTRFAESQLDFDMMCAAGTAIPMVGGRLSNYPYGNRIITFPNLTAVAGSGLFSDTALKDQQSGGPGGNEAFVQMRPSTDYRGETPNVARNEYQDVLQTPEHFDDTHEGFRGSKIYTWSKVFGTTPYNRNQPTPADQQWPSVAQGGLELWVRFEAITNPMTIFDIREQDWLNRLTLRVENGFLILTACDNTMRIPGIPIANGAAEIRQPFLPLENTWYHFGAYWKGNNYTGLALLVDGLAHPQQAFRHVTEASPNTAAMTKLGAALAPTSTSISLLDSSWIPANRPVALRVGREVVIYNGGTITRGARGTAPDPNADPPAGDDHPAQATVSIFGYSSKFRNATISGDVPVGPPAQGSTVRVDLRFDRLTTGGGKTLYKFGERPRATVAGDKRDPPPAPPITYIDAMQTDIGVNEVPPSTIMDYPDQGYILIDEEVIYYTGRSTGGVNGAGTAKFTGCARINEQGTTAARHNTGAMVDLWGVAVDTHTNYLSPTIIQVEDEWFGPVWADQQRAGRPLHWIPQGGLNPMRLYRGNWVFGSRRMAHEAGEKVIPLFVARDSDPDVSMQNLGPWDDVTLADATNAREFARVRCVNAPNWSGVLSINGAGGGAQLAGLWDWTSRAYVPDDLHVRVLKFPSGELMSLKWLESANTDFKVCEGLNGLIDEVKFFASRREDLRFAAIAPAQAGGSSSTVMLRGPDGPRKGGLIRAGSEYIGYGDRQYDNNNNARLSTLTILKRGWLNTAPQVHNVGDRVIDLSYYVPVSCLTQDVDATTRTIPIGQKLAGDDRRYRSGYALIDEEMILFEWGGGNGQPLTTPPRWDGTTGLFRGMFGTTAAPHRANQSLVLGMPWRFWDTYKENEFDNKMAYFQWSTQMDLAKWHALSWTQEVVPADPNILVHARVRVDGKGELYNVPGQTDEKLVYEFANGGASNPINRIGYRNEPGLLEVRFLVEYRKDSFNALSPWEAHSWKRTPKIKEMKITYDRPSKTHFYEER